MDGTDEIRFSSFTFIHEANIFWSWKWGWAPCACPHHYYSSSEFFFFLNGFPSANILAYSPLASKVARASFYKPALSTVFRTVIRCLLDDGGQTGVYKSHLFEEIQSHGLVTCLSENSQMRSFTPHPAWVPQTSLVTQVFSQTTVNQQEAEAVQFVREACGNTE